MNIFLLIVIVMFSSANAMQGHKYCNCAKPSLKSIMSNSTKSYLSSDGDGVKNKITNIAVQEVLNDSFKSDKHLLKGNCSNNITSNPSKIISDSYTESVTSLEKIGSDLYPKSSVQSIHAKNEYSLQNIILENKLSSIGAPFFNILYKIIDNPTDTQSSKSIRINDIVLCSTAVPAISSNLKFINNSTDVNSVMHLNRKHDYIYEGDYCKIQSIETNMKAIVTFLNNMVQQACKIHSVHQSPYFELFIQQPNELIKPIDFKKHFFDSKSQEKPGAISFIADGMIAENQYGYFDLCGDGTAIIMKLMYK